MAGLHDASGISDHFWFIVEREFHRHVPKYVQHLLRAQGLDNHTALRRLDNSVINDLEIFARTEAYKSTVPPNLSLEDLREYYGVFAASPLQFRFILGHKVMLQRIITLSKEKDDSFWAPPKSCRGIERSIADLEKLIMNFHYNGAGADGARKCSTLMRMLIEHLENNSGPSKLNNRYTEPYKKVWMYIYLIGGLTAYGTLAENLPIPSVQSINRYLCHRDPITEGTLDIDGLVDHLTRGGYPFHVYISDDATKIKKDPRYDSITNQIVGFVEPTDENGLPIPNSFKATSIRDMHDYNKNEKVADYIHCYMAQAQAENAPAYCLLMFASDYTFTTEDWLKRCNIIKKLLNERGIVVEGFSAGGDQRCVSGMKQKTKLGIKPEQNKYNIEWFHADLEIKEDFVQDPVHVVNKMRIQISKHSIALPIGDYMVSSTYLLRLTEELPLSKHNLSMSDIDNPDEVDFKPSIKICSRKVYDSLTKIPGSEGTREYVKIMNFATHSYLSTDLNELTRLYCCWYPVFLLRYWRKHLSIVDRLSVQHDCDSLNAYTCLEINAHALVRMLMRQIEDPELKKYFLTWQKSSQPCDCWLKTTRSTTSPFNTYLVPCNVLEARRKAHRIKTISQIMSTDFSKSGEQLNFPKKRDSNTSFGLFNGKKLAVDLDDQPIFKSELSTDSLKAVMKKARQDAYHKIRELGVGDVEIQDGDAPSSVPCVTPN